MRKRFGKKIREKISGRFGFEIDEIKIQGHNDRIKT